MKHINNEGELVELLQELPAGIRHLIIDAIGLPVGIDYKVENLTDYVHRIQDQLVCA